MTMMKWTNVIRNEGKNNNLNPGCHDELKRDMLHCGRKTN